MTLAPHRAADARRVRSRCDGLALACLAAMAFLLTWKAHTIGPTVDEPFHLVRGLAWWWTDSARLSYAHPPLANLLQAAPSNWMARPPDIAALPGWDVGDHSLMAEHLFADHYEVVRPMLFAGRLVNSGLAVLLAALVYAWTSRRVGAVAGLVALVLVAFNPTVLAHGQLFTTDLPVALAILCVAITFVEYLQPPERSIGRGVSLALFAVAVGLAMGTKFTAVGLVPLLAAIGVTWAARGWGRFEGLDARRALPTVLADMAVVAVTSLFVLAALYRFEEVGLTIGEVLDHPEPQCHITQPFDHGFLEQRTIGRLPRWLPAPVPYAWLFGLEMVRHHAADGHSTWFLGFSYGWGNVAYFPILLLIKTPWLALVGLGVAVITMGTRWHRPGLVHGTMLALAGFLLALLMVSNLNIGVRHALPIVPLLTIVAASGLVRAMAWAHQHLGPRGPILGWALLLTLPVATARGAGHYLSWFNVGPIGHRVSMVGEDWGQDTLRLAAEVRQHELRPLAYVPYGIGSLAELRYQGVPFRRVACGEDLSRTGWVALHAARHVRSPDCIPGVSDRPPDRVVADHIYLWRLDPRPDEEDGARRRPASR